MKGVLKVPKDIRSIVREKSVSPKHGSDYLKFHDLAIEEFEKLLKDDEEVLFVNSGSIE